VSMQLSDKDFLTVAKTIIESQEKTIGRVDRLELRFGKLESTVETQVYLTSSQATALKKAVSVRVRELLPEEKEYKEHSKTMFQALWRSLKEVYQVPTYREIPRMHYANAIKYVAEWQPIRLIKAAI
jgi:hypothetical protein